MSEEKKSSASSEFLSTYHPITELKREFPLKSFTYRIVFAWDYEGVDERDGAEKFLNFIIQTPYFLANNCSIECLGETSKGGGIFKKQ